MDKFDYSYGDQLQHSVDPNVIPVAASSSQASSSLAQAQTYGYLQPGEEVGYSGSAFHTPVQNPPPYWAPQQQHQQQQQVSVGFNSDVQMLDVGNESIESYYGHKVFACLVLWLCNCMFGIMAWRLANSADEVKNTDRQRARQLGRYSIGTSIAGIIVSVIIITIVVVINVLSFQNAKTCVHNGYSVRC